MTNGKLKPLSKILASAYALSIPATMFAFWELGTDIGASIASGKVFHSALPMMQNGLDGGDVAITAIGVVGVIGSLKSSLGMECITNNSSAALWRRVAAVSAMTFALAGGTLAQYGADHNAPHATPTTLLVGR